jgi:hypothetical protein
MGEDSINYHKPTYPSFTDDLNRNNGEFTIDNNGVQNAQLTVVPQAVGNSFDDNAPKSLGSYIEQASKSQEILRDGNKIQQLLTVSNGCNTGSNGCKIGSNGLEKQLMNNGEELKLNKYILGEPLRDENGYVNTEHQNERAKKPNTQIYSHLISDSSTYPSFQNGLFMSDNIEEYYYPYDNKKSVIHGLEGRNSPLEESRYSKSSLPKNYLYKDDTFPKPTIYQNHQYDNAQTTDSDLHGNRHENSNWESEQENHQDEYTIYTSYSPVNLLMKHNTLSITNSKPCTTGCVSDYTVQKGTGINEDIRHNEVYSDMPLYLSSDDRRMLQGEFLSKNGNNSPHIQKPLSSNQKYLPGKSSEVLQEDSVLTESISDADAKKTPIYKYKIPDTSNQKLKLSTSQDRTRFTTKNLVLSLPTVSHNKIPSNSQMHTPYFQKDFNKMLNNMERQKVKNAITSTHHNLPVPSQHLIDVSTIPSDELPDFNKINEELKFMQNTEGTSPYNSKAPTLAKELIRVGSMTNYSKNKYEQKAVNTSPYTDEKPTHFSSVNGRNTVSKTKPFPTPNPDKCAPLLHKSIATPQYYQEMSPPSNNIDVENVDFQSQLSTNRIQPQIHYHRQKNYKLADGRKNKEDYSPERDSSAVSIVIPQMKDSFKYSSSAIPSPNEARSAILCMPEEIESVPNTAANSVNDDSPFILHTDSPEGVSPLNLPAYLSRVSERTKNEFLRIFEDTENDSHYVPTSGITSSEHRHLTSARRNSIKTESKGNYDNPFREKLNSPENQYLSNTQEKSAEIYSAATLPPLETTITLRTFPSDSSETYPQAMSLNEYERNTNMGQDVIPTLPSNKKTMYGVTKLVTLEDNRNDVSNSTTQSPYESNQIPWEERSYFSESAHPATDITNAEEEMKEKWNVQSKHSTEVTPNLYEMNRIQDVTDPITDADSSIIGSSTDELKMQLHLVPVNVTYQPNIRDEVTQEQATSYSVTAIRELLTEIPHNRVSDVADIYAAAERQDAHVAATLSTNKNTKPEGSVVLDKRVSAENEGNYYFSHATVLLPDNTTNTVYTNAGTPVTFPSIQENISQHFYGTTVMPQQIEETTQKRGLKTIKTAGPKEGTKYAAKVPTFLKVNKPVIPSRSAAHVKEQVFSDDRTEKSGKPTTVHGSSQNYERQTNTQMEVRNAPKTKANENYTSPETVTSRITQQTYFASPHIPNKTDKYGSTESEITTFQMVTTAIEIMNAMEVTNLPTGRSNFSQSMYSAMPYETQNANRITANLGKLTYDTNWIQKDGSQYLHTDEYGTLQNAPFTTTPYENSNKDKARATINVKSGFENTAADKWNQNNVQDNTATQVANNFDDTGMFQELVTTPGNLHDKENSHAFYSGITKLSTVPPYKNRVTNNYIKVNGTEFGKNNPLLPELENKQDNVIFSERSLNGDTTSVKMNGHTDNFTLQHLIPETLEPFLNLETLPSKDILHENIRGMTKNTIKDVVNSTDIVSKPHESKELVQDHTTLQPSDYLQLLAYTTNSLSQMMSEDGTNTIPTRTNYAKGSEPQMDITTEQTLVMYHEKNQELHTETSESAGLSTSKINTYETNTDLEQDMSQQRHTSNNYTPHTEAYNNHPAVRHNNHPSSIQRPKEMQESLKTKQQKTENTTQAENLYTNLHQDNLKHANKDGNVKHDKKFDTEEFTRNHEVLSPNYRKVVPEYNTDSSVSTLQIQTQPKNKESYSSALDHIDEPRYTPKDYNEVFHTVIQHTSALSVQNTNYSAHRQQFGVVMEKTITVQGGSERSRNIQNSDTTNSVNHSDEDDKNTASALEKTLMFLLQNKDKIKLLLDLPYSHTIASAPSKPTGRENQSHLTKQPVGVDRKQTEAINSGSNKIIPVSLDQSSRKATALNHEPLKNIMRDSIKSEDTIYIPPSSIEENKGQIKSPQEIHSVKSECNETSDISKDKYNLRNQEKMQQTPVSRKKYSSDDFLLPSLKVRLEVEYKMDKEPQHEFELTADTAGSDATRVTGANMNYLPQKSNMRTERSTHGPFAWHKNFPFMPASGPQLNQNKALRHYLLLSPDQNINSSYEVNINSEPVYGNKMDTSLESEETAQDLSLHLHNQLHNIYNNIKSIQQSDTLSEKEMVVENNTVENDNENQSLSDGRTTHIYNIFDLAQPFKRFTYDEKSLQPKLYSTRKSQSYENKNDISEESFKQVIKNNIVGSRPGALGNQKYKRLSEEVIQFKPSAFMNHNNPYKHLSSNINNSEEDIRAILSGFKKSEMNKQGHDDNNGEKMHDTIHVSMSDISDDTEVLNKHNINCKKKLPPEEVQNISQNFYRYLNDCKYPTIDQNDKENNDIHKHSLQHLLQSNDSIYHQPDDNGKIQQVYSSSDKYETNENSDNDVVRRTRNMVQYMTTNSSDKKDEVYPKYQFSSCQPHKCQGVLTSELKIVTTILKWLKNLATDTTKT